MLPDRRLPFRYDDDDRRRDTDDAYLALCIRQNLVRRLEDERRSRGDPEERAFLASLLLLLGHCPAMPRRWGG